LSAGFVVRTFGDVDIDLACVLHRDAFVPMGERAWTHQEMAELLASPGVAGIVLQSDGKKIGFALCRTAADEAELLTIAVHADWRRRGAGYALVKAASDLVRARGAREFFLEVGDDNASARKLYERTGFKVVGHRIAYYRRANRPAVDALVMRLPLV